MNDAILTGFSAGLSLILAIGSQNAFVLRQGLRGEHVGLVCLACALSDAVLISLGVVGFRQVSAMAGWLVPLFRWCGADVWSVAPSGCLWRFGKSGTGGRRWCAAVAHASNLSGADLDEPTCLSGYRHSVGVDIHAFSGAGNTLCAGGDDGLVPVLLLAGPWRTPAATAFCHAPRLAGTGFRGWHYDVGNSCAAGVGGAVRIKAMSAGCFDRNRSQPRPCVASGSAESHVFPAVLRNALIGPNI